MEAWEGRAELLEGQRGEDQAFEVEGASLEGTLPSLAGDQGGRSPKWASRSWGPSLRTPSKGTRGSASPPRSYRRRRGICKPPPCSINWEHLLAPLGSGVQSAPQPTLPAPSSALLTPHSHPLPCPGQGGTKVQVKLKLGRGPGTFCSFLYHTIGCQARNV